MSKNKQDFITDFLFEVNGQFHQPYYDMLDSFYDLLQKEYEEKLRWIAVEEKHSPNWEHVLLKQSNGKITIGCYMSSQFNVEMCSDTIRVTHWRFIL